MKNDWRFRLLGIQGLLFASLFAIGLTLYLSRPRYAPTAAYEAAHNSWEMAVNTLGVVFLVSSLSVTLWFRNRYRTTITPRQ